ADIDQPGLAHGDAVHYLRKGGGSAGLRFVLRRLPSPLPEKLAVAVENGDAAVSIAVRHVDVAVHRVDGHARRIEEAGLACVQPLALGSAVRRVESPAPADLQQ